MINFDEEPWVNTVEKLEKFRKEQKPEFQAKIDEAIEVIDKILDSYRYYFIKNFIRI